ncbi:hypothetical protein O6H91_11G058500 [Diphasiastrum complanatum]|nr:hypothetical protein O6H91_11G058500 [Diphasiastrum complanatum]
MAKDSFFDPKTGVNALEVGFIDQSAALQRAGRAGRTQPGICYRLYSKLQFEKMEHHRKPEILRVHLGVAILKLLALGIKEPETFNFVQAPSSEAISSALKTLHHLGAIEKHSTWKLTTLGLQLQKLGMEPRTGKVLLDCIARGYGREGLALAALMSSFGTIFFRAGTEEEKARADRLKMKFCHPDSDLFTLLLVYKEWEMIPFKSKKRWCLNNSINHKTLQRCQELIKELESCLYYELNIEVCRCWGWSSNSAKSDSIILQKIILSVLVDNLAVFSGHERLGYDVISSMQNAYLHPSSAVLVYGNMPKWVIFVQLICTSTKFLHCVTVIDPEWLHEESVFCYNVQLIESSVLHSIVFSNLGAQLLRNICGKQNQKLIQLKNLIRREERRCIIDPDYEKNELRVLVTSNDLQFAKDIVEEVVQRERRWLHNQCVERRLFQKVSELDSPAMLFGAGAMVRDILMPGEFASVEVFHPEPSLINEAEILVLFDKCGEGIGSVQRCYQASRKGALKKWGVITLRSFTSAKLAVDWISEKQMGMHALTVVPIKSQKQGNTHKSSLDALKATLTCLRRRANGIAIIKCEAKEVDAVIKSCRGRLVCGSVINCYPDCRRPDSVCIQGLKCNVFSSDVEDELRSILQRPDLHVWTHRRPAPLHPSNAEFQNALVKKISSYVPVSKCEVVVSPLVSDKDQTFKAYVKFDESQLEAAETALHSLHGLVLPNCQPWQALRCLPLFSTSLHCNSLIFKVLKEEFDYVIQDLGQRHKGVTFSKELTRTGGHRIQISATSLSVAAGCRATLEKLMEGTAISDYVHEQGALSILFTREGLSLVKRVEIQTNTYISVDKRIHSVKVYGPKIRKDSAIEKITNAVDQLHEKHKGKEILLRGEDLPQGLMKEVVQQFGADLACLQDIAGVPIKMDHRKQSLHVYGETEAVQKVQSALAGLATTLKGSDIKVVAEECDTDIKCSVCFSPVEDKYSLEGCGHSFCRSCLVDQISSLIHHREGFPLACTYEECGQPFLMADVEALLSNEQQEELQRASLSVFVVASRGSYKFCSTPDCPVVYRASSSGQLFTCPACSVRLCTSCHVEYHEGLSCELYRTYRQDPDTSLQAWRDGKEDVKDCPSCHCVIEKIEGCNHVTCKCGMHVCWICLTHFGDSSACYSHLREMHGGFV